MTFIVIGMVIPAFADSPRNKGDKTTTDNVSTSPPSNWNVLIIVTDPKDTCSAYKYCSLEFFWQPGSLTNCTSVSATPTGTAPITWGQTNYSLSIPDSISCVRVMIIDPTGTCPFPFNSNFCCSCRSGSGNPCYLKICP